MLRSSVAPLDVTMKLVAEVAVPPAVVTVILPDVVALATVAVICVVLLTVNPLAALPLNATEVTPVKFVPVMTIEVPTGPVPGLKLEIVGAGGLIVKSVDEVPVPLAVATVILPVVVPLPTTTVICVALLTVKLVADTELNFTDVAPVKFVPAIVTEVPATPLKGVKLEIVGGSVTVKLPADVPVPAEVVTEILPVLEPAAIVAVI